MAKKKNTAAVENVDPVVQAYLDENAERLAATKSAKEADMEKPFDKDALLEVRHLRKTFTLEKTLLGKPVRELVAVDDVSFKLFAGETLGVVGESGCGKTTLGRAILKLHQPTGGQIIFKGKDITKYKTAQMRPLRTKMQIIFQDPSLPFLPVAP